MIFKILPMMNNRPADDTPHSRSHSRESESNDMLFDYYWDYKMKYYSSVWFNILHTQTISTPNSKQMNSSPTGDGTVITQQMDAEGGMDGGRSVRPGYCNLLEIHRRSDGLYDNLLVTSAVLCSNVPFRILYCLAPGAATCRTTLSIPSTGRTFLVNQYFWRWQDMSCPNQTSRSFFLLLV